MKQVKLILILISITISVAFAQIPKPTDCSVGFSDIIVPTSDMVLSSSVTLSWTYAGSGAQYILFYRATNAANNIAWTELTDVGRSYTLSGLIPGGQYDFYVTAYKTCYDNQGNPFGTAANSSEPITIGLDPLPPIISSNNGSQLTEEISSLQLSTSIGFDQYTWYLNGQVIAGASGANLTATLPGTYLVSACGTFQDGGYSCESSPVFEVTGLHLNFVKTITTQVENITDLSLFSRLNVDQVNVATTYSDGFARPIESVLQGVSPQGKDIISFIKYDAFGRQPRHFLPMASLLADGSYHHMPNSLQPLLNFYLRDNDNIANTQFPFAETLFEGSYLSRVLKQGAEGEEWQLPTNDTEAGHIKRLNYSSNKASDNIWIWIESATSLSANGFYPDGSLVLFESFDENGKIYREYKDKDDHNVLIEKVIEGGIKLRTYFVFNDLGMLSHVIPPNAVAALASAPTASITNEIIQRECYKFQYDERGRVVAKCIPGGGCSYFIYDPWDRIVLVQNANQRPVNKWSFTKFDAMDRVILTGEISIAGDNVAVTQAIASFYAGVATNPTLRYEETGGNIHGYTNRSFPVLLNEFQAYSAAYFDDYDFLSQFGTGYQFVQEPTLDLTANSTNTRRLITGLKTIILGTHNYLKTANFYDRRLRLIQVVTSNQKGGIDRTSNALDFVGKITKMKIVHNGLQPVTINQEFTYDHVGRKLKSFHSINNSPKILLCDYQYNELGQLIEKNIHSDDNGNKFLQSQDYLYTIRGWLSSINPPNNPSEIELNVIFQDQYGFDLSYTAPAGTAPNFQPAFNGNITAYTQRRGADKSGYSYHYDLRDQIIKADYFQPSNPVNGAFDMPVITYDLNGNIKSLQRKGGTINLIDDLIYSYNGNQLLQVLDNADKTTGFIKK